MEAMTMPVGVGVLAPMAAGLGLWGVVVRFV
jgi:hypothetical protein